MLKVFFKWFNSIRFESRELKIKICKKSILFLLPVFNRAKPMKKIVDLFSYGDANIGKQLANGRYIFSGVQFDLDVDNPWLIEIPSPEVEQKLHGFFWLNDLAALGNSKARIKAVEWITKWHFYNSIGNQIGWDADITALRCINLLRNWDFLNKAPNENFQRNLKFLWRQYKFLTLIFRIYPTGLKKVKIVFSIFLLALFFDVKTRTKKKIQKKLCQLLKKTVDLNGRIASRCPEDFLDFFVIILDVLSINEKQKLLNKTDLTGLQKLKNIMAPILRGLRLGDGSLTRTHGGDVGFAGLIDNYLVNSNVKSPPAFRNILGFERITAGRLILIVDCAKPYQGIDMDSSHASCLSFELSSGQRPIFVNCGPGERFGAAFKSYCRSTQAHNSCTLGNISQLQYEFISRKKRWPKEIVSHGPRNIKVVREKTFEATWLNLSHDSYENKYGYIHNRKLFLLNSGKIFTGTDSFETSKERKNKQNKNVNFYAYFQLHPDVELWDHPRLQTIILRLKNGEHWIFESDLGTVNIEESTFIDSTISRPLSTKRIVIKSSTLLNKTEIKWSLRRREIVTRNTRDVDLVH